MFGLGALAQRRTLPPWLLVGLVFLLALASGSSRTVPLIEGDETASAGLRGLARQNIWSVLLVLAPLVFHQAARLGTNLTNEWLTTTPASRSRRSLALVRGCVATCALATLLTATVCELGMNAAATAWQRASLGPNPSALLLDDSPSVRWDVPEPEPGVRLRLWTTVAIGSGPAVRARFTARFHTGPDTEVSPSHPPLVVEAHVAGRTAMELALPQPCPQGPLRLELERLGTGAVLVLPPDALEQLEPVASERLAALRLGTRAFFLLSVGCALAFGLGRRLRPVLATGLVLALVLLSWSSPAAALWIPCADLAEVWSTLGSGLVPVRMPIGAWVGSLVLLTLGIALQAGPGGTQEGRR